jgi:hypothetical protein
MNTAWSHDVDEVFGTHRVSGRPLLRSYPMSVPKCGTGINGTASGNHSYGTPRTWRPVTGAGHCRLAGQFAQQAHDRLK